MAVTASVYRVAAWSAILASPCTPAWSGSSLGVLGSSVLPGICQTAFRAELYALGFALHCAARHGDRVRSWLDCLNVINKFTLVLHGGWKISPNMPHADLWTWIEASVCTLGAEKIRVYKVPAHRRLENAVDRPDLWRMYHNNAADCAAKLANQQRTQEFWQFWQHMAVPCAWCHGFRGVVATGCFTFGSSGPTTGLGSTIV